MYDLSTLLQFLIGGLSLGCIYGLVGIAGVYRAVAWKGMHSASLPLATR